MFFGLAFLQASFCLDKGERFQNGTIKPETENKFVNEKGVKRL
jgi:hypothetical protein